MLTKEQRAAAADVIKAADEVIMALCSLMEGKRDERHSIICDRWAKEYAGSTAVGRELNDAPRNLKQHIASIVNSIALSIIQEGAPYSRVGVLPTDDEGA